MGLFTDNFLSDLLCVMKITLQFGVSITNCFVSVTVVIFFWKICTFNLPKEPKFRGRLDIVEMFDCEKIQLVGESVFDWFTSFVAYLPTPWVQKSGDVKEIIVLYECHFRQCLNILRKSPEGLPKVPDDHLRYDWRKQRAKTAPTFCHVLRNLIGCFLTNYDTR